MKFEIINGIKNRIIELDNLLWEMTSEEYRDEGPELVKEFNRLNKMLEIAEGK